MQRESENFKDIYLGYLVVDICCADEHAEEAVLLPQALGLGPRISTLSSPPLLWSPRGGCNQMLTANSNSFSGTGTHSL